MRITAKGVALGLGLIALACILGLGGGWFAWELAQLIGESL